MIKFIIPLFLFLPATGWAQSWPDTKNTADDVIYTLDQRSTFYCGCSYTSHEDSDGSGSIDDLEACGYDGGNNASSRAHHPIHCRPYSIVIGQ